MVQLVFYDRTYSSDCDSVVSFGSIIKIANHTINKIEIIITFKFYWF